MAVEFEQLPDQDLEPEPKVNANNDSLGQKWTFAHISGASSGLVVRIGGGPYALADRSGADLTATDDATNYIVAARSNGALSIATSTTNWNNTTTYGRVGIATFADGVLTYLDARDDQGGIFDHAGTPGAVSASGVSITDSGGHYTSDNVEGALGEIGDAIALLTAGAGVSGLDYTADTASQADSDPGTGNVRWNNATQASATILYVDNATADGTSMATFFAEITSGSFITLHAADDPHQWQKWKVTSTPIDGTGYYKFAVSLEASEGSAFADNEALLIDFDVASQVVNPTEVIAIACSDETTPLTTGTAKVTFRMPYAFTLSAVRASVSTAPTGAALIIDINESGSTIMATNKLSIDAGEKTSTTAATPAALTDTALADDAEITIDFDQVGSTIAGAGAKVYLIGARP